MAIKVAAHPFARQSASSDRSEIGGSADADLATWRRALKQAMQDTGWNPEALDALWGTSRGYAWRLCEGEKSWSLERVLALPCEVRARLAKYEAEAHGLIVVEPMTGTEAQRAFIAGFLGLFQTQLLPAKADQMAQAALPAAAPARRSA